MILELGDGRELQLPDEVSDEFARQLKALVLTCEERARNAESQVRLLRDEMAAMRQAFSTVRSEHNSAEATVFSIRELQTSTLRALANLERAVLADRVMVQDEFGEYTKSRAVK